MHQAATTIIAAARERGQAILTEFEGKALLAGYGVPVVEERMVSDLAGARTAAAAIGYPVALKACSEKLAHKTEAGLVALRLRDERDLDDAFAMVSDRIPPDIAGVTFLVQKMMGGARELVIGMIRDAQFGAAVMFGLGGIFTEVLADVTFRLAPLTPFDAADMIDEIEGRRILDRVRGMAAVDRDALTRSLLALSAIAVEHKAIRAIDVNPMIVGADGRPVAVDALVVL
jgi:acetate---CoA ligase (ADP-forming) subunit beta